MAQKNTTVSDIQAVLRQYPQVFLDHPELLEELELPGLGDPKVISLERLHNRHLRSRIDRLEEELGQLLSCARHNDRLTQQLHTLSLELLQTRDLDELRLNLLEGLRTSFQVEWAALCLVRERFAKELEGRFLLPQEWLQARFSNRLRVKLAPPEEEPELTQKIFGVQPQEAFRSQALVALLDRRTPIGVMGIGSRVAERYIPGMETTYLERLAELIAALLVRPD